MSITIKNLTHKYNEGMPFEKTALKDINIEIKTGEFVGIIGHTGSGKSTLIQMFNGLIKPTMGQVLVNGEDITAKSNITVTITDPNGNVVTTVDNNVIGTFTIKYNVKYETHSEELIRTITISEKS